MSYPEITSIDISDNRKIEIKYQFDYFNFTIVFRKRNQVAIYVYENDFRNEIKSLKDKTKLLTKKVLNLKKPVIE